MLVLLLIAALIILSLMFGGFQKGTKSGGLAPAGPLCTACVKNGFAATPTFASFDVDAALFDVDAAFMLLERNAALLVLITSGYTRPWLLQPLVLLRSRENLVTGDPCPLSGAVRRIRRGCLTHVVRTA